MSLDCAGNHRVQLFDGLDFMLHFGTSEVDGQSLRLPTDVAVNSERQILVADSGNNRVVLASVQGEWLAVFGSSSGSDLDPVASRLMQVSNKCITFSPPM